ncbi:hypothetical protein SY88_11235 [Clostridiales bacterium PH28_bin88]|nr:hypothetical protein SY88_11235 [Clostridiales bacterium PH28_bin88]
MGQLTEREKEILSLLRQDPMISQEELANRLNISRSATAVHISNIIKKGAILGRGYVFGEDPGIVVVGTTELTIAASTMEDPLDTGLPEGSITVSCGGAGFHLAGDSQP